MASSKQVSDLVGKQVDEMIKFGWWSACPWLQVEPNLEQHKGNHHQIAFEDRAFAPADTKACTWEWLDGCIHNHAKCCAPFPQNLPCRTQNQTLVRTVGGSWQAFLVPGMHVYCSAYRSLLYACDPAGGWKLSNSNNAKPCKTGLSWKGQSCFKASWFHGLLVQPTGTNGWLPPYIQNQI